MSIGVTLPEIEESEPPAMDRPPSPDTSYGDEWPEPNASNPSFS